jgi:N6-L-threonylcarbamoyladenine synthase
MSNFLTLAIESSCDETSAAILNHQKVIALVTATQSVHEQYGGVVPELASRAHQSNIIPVVDAVLKEAQMTLNEMDLLCVTEGPGLMGSLHVGVSFMKAVALSLKKPLVGVNHMHGHVLAHCIEGQYAHPIEFPFLCLTVSGGHTQIVWAQSPTELSVLAQTKDDAAGEAIDKAAKLLGLPYPGGPMVDKKSKEGNAQAFQFSVPKIDDGQYSFSGLKTSLLYFLQAQTKENPNFIAENLADLCASFQKITMDYLLKNFFNWAKKMEVKNVAIAGGVSANSYLRETFETRGKQLNMQTFIPRFDYCTDNAAMIGISGYHQYQKNYLERNIVPQPRMEF